VFKKDPEYPLTRGHFKNGIMGKDTSESYRKKHQEKKVEMDTLRKPENNITRSALEWNPQGFKRRGRPKQSWRRSVLDELAKKNVTWIEAKRIAKNSQVEVHG